MRLKLFLRPSLAIVLGFVGALVAKNSTPQAVLTITGDYFLIVAALAFGTLGFILPDILELAGRAGIAALANQIVGYLPKYPGGFGLGKKAKISRKYQTPLVVDTSALIDGRVVDIARTGFIWGDLLVIPSVVGELHRLADSPDHLKRVKGRRGLDNLATLQKEKATKVVVLNSEPADRTVDDKLVKAAREVRGKIVTVDYNLNKVAKIKGITVLNVNELANAVKTAVLPGERLQIQVNFQGKAKNQGVGYLADGTMVVVEEGAGQVGKKIEVLVHRVIQTAAGKMVFAKPAS